ncbi:MAG: tRNA uridine-5-carboxymethylaminomethyl(34) synthesis enzyme MnmG [candidate division KSB1 bacterium]|nr:tRNA uridine-5-carboxymethylaminomethyl(34) synthesis enzyme MnmG [candidate division KSB1 bacterium]
MVPKGETYDVIVVGAGHAGCEAALAAARMGAKTVLFTMNLFTVAQMSCNPAIGGLAKGHLVREIDALGGEMGLATDEQGIQFRMLNRSKGPAVWAPRAQADRIGYALRMKRALENQPNLDLKQAMVTEVVVENGKIKGVKTQTGWLVEGKTVILTTGTFLNGLIHIGMVSYPAGRAGEFPATGLTECLTKLGFQSGRLKTGTPPRVDGKTIDFEKLTPQYGDDPPVPFSYRTPKITVEQIPCYLTATNPRTHEILRSGLDRSPLYTGKIIGIGPRYCPSIETKIVRFQEKQSHQIFLEPEGRQTQEYYVNGFATSLPEDVQLRALNTIAGLEKAKITRLGYAIEYDFFPPTQLKPSLETKLVDHLFFAGQINGTSGYEEAAAQGLMAGINAVLKIRGEEPFILDRSEAYIGVLIDDLVTKGTQEPYRMFTSLAEYRLLLRQDNADLRLMEYGYKLGLIPEASYRTLVEKKRRIQQSLEDLKRIKVAPEQINPLLEKLGTAPIPYRESLFQLLKRPQVRLKDLTGQNEHPLLSKLDDSLWDSVREQVEIEVKYEGFIQRQREQVEKFKKLEARQLPENLDYQQIRALSVEAREKLSQIRPRSLGQASRISGVSPADVTVIMIHLAKLRGAPMENVSRET